MHSQFPHFWLSVQELWLWLLGQTQVQSGQQQPLILVRLRVSSKQLKYTYILNRLRDIGEARIAIEGALGGAGADGFSDRRIGNRVNSPSSLSFDGCRLPL